MAYQFVNRTTGKAALTKSGTTTTINVAGVNTQTNDADKFHRGIQLFVDIVGWTPQDINRVVTQDIEAT